MSRFTSHSFLELLQVGLELKRRDFFIPSCTKFPVRFVAVPIRCLLLGGQMRDKLTKRVMDALRDKAKADGKTQYLWDRISQASALFVPKPVHAAILLNIAWAAAAPNRNG